MGLLEGKVALVTGAARGIGRTIAKKFASEGAAVAFTVKDIDDDSRIAEEEIRSFGGKVLMILADAADFEKAHEVVDRVVAEFGRIDVLVNNAGIADDALMYRLTEEQWDRTMSVNLKSAFNHIHAVAPVMGRQRSGSIISLASVVGLFGNSGQCAYAASKAGIIGMSKSFAKELGCRGVRTNCIAPGFIDTDMTAKVPESMRKEWVDRISMRRAGKPEEVAGVALFLASDLSSYVNGQVINCCGGFTF